MLTCFYALGGCLAGIMRWVREKVRISIEAILLRRVGSGDMVGEGGSTAPVVRGRVEGSKANGGRRRVSIQGAC